MRAIRNPGRVVGLWYLSLVLLGPLTLLYIPNKLFVHNDATATASNIAAHQLLFKVGMLADLGGSMLGIFLVFAFYRLFKDVDQQLAMWLVITGGVMPAVLQLVNFVNEAGALLVAQGPDFLSAFDKAQRDALVMLFVHLHENQITAAEILWGAWLFPMGALTYKSGFLPRFIGVWLIINGIAYVVLSASRVMLPGYSDKLFMYLQPALLGELVIVLWLVIKGAGQTPLRAAPDPASPPPRTR
jgi:hypothetical protein